MLKGNLARGLADYSPGPHPAATCPFVHLPPMAAPALVWQRSIDAEWIVVTDSARLASRACSLCSGTGSQAEKGPGLGLVLAAAILKVWTILNKGPCVLSFP